MEGDGDHIRKQRTLDDELRLRVANICPWFAKSDEDVYREVNDADEEIFLLYTLSAAEPDRIGLGQVNDRSDRLEITFDAEDLATAPIVSVSTHEADRENGSKRPKVTKEHKVSLRQSSTSIKSTAGDTGSVVWRSSMHLTHKILFDFSQNAGQARTGRRRGLLSKSDCLLNPDAMPSLRILELGAGTGIVPAAILSNPYVDMQQCIWTVTDQDSMINLLERNVGRTTCLVRELDWMQASTIYQQGTASAKQNFVFNYAATNAFDLILATDCIFNPSLFQSFLDTLTLFAVPRQTCVLVVCELRQSDMMHDFLSAWLEHRGRWTIYTLEAKHVLGPRLSRGCVVWLGWRS